MRLNNLTWAALKTTLAILVSAAASAAWAQPWVSFADNTRYLALGDSLSAGYDAKPVTQGFVYQLYQGGVIDNINNLLFCNQAVPGATSTDVLNYQVPQAPLFLSDTGSEYRKVITLTVGGNDMLSLLKADGTVDMSKLEAVVGNYATNLGTILGSLATSFPTAKVYVGNIYDPKLPITGEEQLIALLNYYTATVVGGFPSDRVVLVDLFSAFQNRSGLLLIEKKGAGFNIHPTNAGYQVMTKAFADAIVRR